MVLTMAPTVAFAADTTSDPAAQSNPVAQIKGAQKSSVYFGNYKQSSDGNGDYLTEPIKWRVLQSADGKLFLLADKILDVYYYHHNGSTSSPALGSSHRHPRSHTRQPVRSVWFPGHIWYLPKYHNSCGRRGC